MFEVVKDNSLKDLNAFLDSHDLPRVSNEEVNNNPFLNLVIYKENSEIIGYLNYSIIYDKAELNYIFVDLEYRKNGIGSVLLEYLIEKCGDCQNITLEVRKDNIPAISLYKKYGFIECAIRKNYYDGIDGILMMRKRGE